jgi:AcrR family transcriptional regulator
VLGERGAARREEILDAAVELFARNGYRGTGLVALGKRVGMSHVGILSYFGTKESLLKAVMDRRGQVRESQERTYEGVGITGYINIGPPSEPEILIRLSTVLRAENLSPGDPLHEFFVEKNQRLRGLIAELIRSGQADGEIRPDIDPELKAIEIVAYTIGIDTQWLLNPNEIDLDKVYESFARALTEDLTRFDKPRNAAKTATTGKQQPSVSGSSMPIRRPKKKQASGQSAATRTPSKG